MMKHDKIFCADRGITLNIFEVIKKPAGQLVGVYCHRADFSFFFSSEENVIVWIN